MDGKGAGPSQGPSTSGTQQQPQLVTRMQQLLATLNVEEYEPRVVNQLVDFVYRYISEVLQDAEAFNGSAGETQNSWIYQPTATAYRALRCATPRCKVVLP